MSGKRTVYFTAPVYGLLTNPLTSATVGLGYVTKAGFDASDSSADTNFHTTTRFRRWPTLGGCEPEVGSEAWCEKMQETPKGEWTMNAAADYTKHCILKLDEPASNP